MTNLVDNSSLNDMNKAECMLHGVASSYVSKWYVQKIHSLIYTEAEAVYVETTYGKVIVPAKHGAWMPAQCQYRIISKSSIPNLYVSEPNHYR